MKLSLRIQIIEGLLEKPHTVTVACSGIIFLNYRMNLNLNEFEGMTLQRVYQLYAQLVV